jgi:hypothetical protein
MRLPAAEARAPGKATAGGRPRAVTFASFMVAFLVAGRTGADDASAPVALHAEVKCEALAGPGKVQCAVRERPLGGKLRWGDVIVLSAPPFAPPLRTRLATGDASRSDEDGADFLLALGATADGIGKLRVLARAVVCGQTGCRPVRAEAAASVAVGVAVDAGGADR